MLKGTLDDFTLPDVFRLLSYAKKTGRLDVNRSAGEGEVFFRDGEVYFAQSSLSRDPLGQRLIRVNALTEGQLRKALDENAATGQRVGEILVDSGVVSPEQIEAVVRSQIEDAAFDLLRWELGEFSWEPDVTAEIEIQLGVSVENLIIEASRRLDELEVIKRKIPSAESVLMMAPKPPEGAVEINITPDEWRVLVLVDGARTVSEIGEMGGMDEFQAMRAFYGLVSAGLVEVKSSPRVETPAAAPPEPVEAIEETVVEPVEAIEETVVEPVEAIEETVVEPVEAIEETVVEPVEAIEETVVEPVEAIEETVVEPVEAIEETAGPEAEEEEQEAKEEEEPEADVSEPAVVEEEERFSPAAGLDVTSEFLVSSEDEPPPEGWLDEPDVSVDQFDAPGPDEVSTETPLGGPGEEKGQDTFLTELLDEQADVAEPSAGRVEEGSTEALEGSAEVVEEERSEAPEPPGAAPQVDRAAVVRELAGLFSEEDAPSPRPASSGRARRPTAKPSPEDEPKDDKKRVEDDDQLNKGLISRLIDGVKGL